VPDLFDMELRATRRDRAARLGTELFLYERAFEDCLDRLSLVQRGFERAMLIGCPDPDWRRRLHDFAGDVDVRDPGPAFAQAASGEVVVEDNWTPAPSTYDLMLAIGTLDTVNDLPRALLSLRLAMNPGGLFLGAFSGGDTLPQLRAAVRDADAVTGVASPHVHPRIEASALAPLLTRCGFLDAVVDIDRAQVSYSSLARLVADLRGMGTTNMLDQRSKRSLSRAALAAASTAFARAGDGDRTTETFEILHFACWSPSAP
jgi:NADH dehydrogenase [ubiquinone] 1 alpha subcomplex assembly factor 5